MKQLIENFQKKWPTYLLEILVLIVGIYGAFVVENWNESRKERQKEKDYILRFMQDLRNDTTLLSKELSSAQVKYAEAKEAYSFITDEDYLIGDTTNFLIKLQDIGRTNKTRIHQNTYSDLISTGNSSIIEDKVILDKILTYYSNIPTEWFEEEYIRRMWEGYLPNAINALDLDLLEEILNQDKTTQFNADNQYEITIDNAVAIPMLSKFKKSPNIEYQTKNITRTHLVHQYFLSKVKLQGAELLQSLDQYYHEL